MNKKKSKLRGFTLIELLVVIAVIGILMGMVGPKVFDLLTSSKVKKSQSIFRSWVTQLYQYKEFYKYFPPFLLEEDEGVPMLLSDSENHESFIIALKGMRWDPDLTEWQPIDQGSELRDQNRKGREFHSFSEDEFGPDGYLADSWAGTKIRVVVDQDGDGLIKLGSSAVDEIISALKQDYNSEVVDNAKDKLSVIREKVGIYVLVDETGETESENVFSWDVGKYLEED
ncbi:MAG: prepilin-type N-terminal cleavage/methylation domain-containing protein [Opitutales bacterium]|nr:prepilin-type N-terminal cleavage/methylation domain-containing protein [Opitutales bacterium]MDG1324979.1 prepilin-type N-terminal cleavage/methylation domain-containing protein [Opitutales bacterium]